MPKVEPKALLGAHGPASALLVIDVQTGLFQQSTPIYQHEELLTAINSLVDRAHQAGAPVIYIQHTNDSRFAEGSAGWQLHAQIRPQATDHLIGKHHSNAFEDTGLAGLLESRRVGRLVVTGLVTHGCVKATCLGALPLGYSVVLVADGHSSYSKDAARLIREWNGKLSQAGVELKPASEVSFA
jgi:nicotinamidase-related amidase